MWVKYAKNGMLEEHLFQKGLFTEPKISSYRVETVFKSQKLNMFNFFPQVPRSNTVCNKVTRCLHGLYTVLQGLSRFIKESTRFSKDLTRMNTERWTVLIRVRSLNVWKHFPTTGKISSYFPEHDTVLTPRCPSWDRVSPCRDRVEPQLAPCS